MQELTRKDLLKSAVAVLSAYSSKKQEIGWLCYQERGFGLYENAKFETLAWKNKETHNE
jgi:hypothetical protein